MTRRERLERRLELRQQWATSRRSKAAERFAQADPYRGDIAFNTQPGHIPERARVIRATEKGFEHAQMAAHHDGKAAGITAQLETSIYSDDADAPERLRERIEELQAKRDRMKQVNQLYKKADVAGLAALGVDYEALKVRLAEAGAYWGSKPHLPYEFTNLGGNIRRLEGRLQEVTARAARTAQAEAAPSGVVIEGGDWIRVTFADKPAREILEALKGAGYLWRGGGWVGERRLLPEAVSAMVGS